MQRIVNQRGVSFLVVFVILLVAGCTGSDPLTPSNGEIRVAAVGAKIGGRFVDSPDDTALTSVRRINVRPTDPQASDALGPDDLGLLPRPFSLNFINRTGGADDRPLTSGTYELTTIDVQSYTFEDVDPVDPNDFADPNNPTCDDFVRRYGFISASGVGLNLSDFGQDVLRSVSFESPSSLIVIFDEQAFVDAIAVSMPCSDQCPCVLNWQTDPDPDCVCTTISADPNVGVLAGLAPTYLSFE
jgi:hypothetical protein